MLLYLTQHPLPFLLPQHTPRFMQSPPLHHAAHVPQDRAQDLGWIGDIHWARRLAWTRDPVQVKAGQEVSWRLQGQNHLVFRRKKESCSVRGISSPGGPGFYSVVKLGQQHEFCTQGREPAWIWGTISRAKYGPETQSTRNPDLLK